MKHIIPFLQDNNYKVNDYIVYRLDYSDYPAEFKKGKIIGINKYITSPYKILTEDDNIISLLSNKIIRKLTEEEKQEYIIRKDSDKYNL